MEMVARDMEGGRAIEGWTHGNRGWASEMKYSKSFLLEPV
jgi:hypothetical protein